MEPAAAKSAICHDDDLFIFADSGSHLIKKVVLNGGVVLKAGGNNFTHQRDGSAIT
ncbi:hypothetical protein GCM10011328_26690 [Hafnia psychrotolerans]|uniref:Uncharacterized protein n=1 Tax=Hafnia psychrotolerans TaxID=1477018 RepID=A0ABQ1GTV9_9GAMM|nr:hypothetical protein GCM10011328_26690 [Hafnia psychrotolerans]